MTDAAVAQRLPLDAAGPGATGAWGMILLIVTEASLFVYLLFSYFYLGSMARGTWPPSGPPELRLALPNTIILLVSSGTMWWAESGIRRGAAGAAARSGCWSRWHWASSSSRSSSSSTAGKHFTPHTNAYGSLFYHDHGISRGARGGRAAHDSGDSVRAWAWPLFGAAAPRGHERHLVLALRRRGVARGVHVAIPLPAFFLTA